MQHRTHIARMLREFAPGYVKYADFAVTAPTVDAAMVRARRIDPVLLARHRAMFYEQDSA